MVRLVVAVLACLSLSACVSLQSYRTAAPYGPVEEPPFTDADGNPIHIGFVELDDHGLYWSGRQLPASMKMIENAAADNGAIFQSFRDWKGTPMDGVFPSQRTVYAKTMGHLPEIWSHDVTFTDLGAARTNEERERAAPCIAGEGTGGEICFVVGDDLFVMTPRNPRFNDTHYWIMELPKSIVNGHSDIWNPVWVNMLIGMMETLGPVR